MNLKDTPVLRLGSAATGLKNTDLRAKKLRQHFSIQLADLRKLRCEEVVGTMIKNGSRPASGCFPVGLVIHRREKANNLIGECTNGRPGRTSEINR